MGGALHLEREPARRVAWRALANDFLASDYRAAMSALTGLDLGDAPSRSTSFGYPPGGSHGAHPIMGQESSPTSCTSMSVWNDDDGGLPDDPSFLRSPGRRHDGLALVGSSAVLIRSNDSWHAVSKWRNSAAIPRTSRTATF